MVNGKTKGLGSRLRGLQTASAQRLHVILAIATKDCAQMEINLHEAFKDQRVSGEWFRLTGNHMSMIKEELGDQVHECGFDIPSRRHAELEAAGMYLKENGGEATTTPYQN